MHFAVIRLKAVPMFCQDSDKKMSASESFLSSLRLVKNILLEGKVGKMHNDLPLKIDFE